MMDGAVYPMLAAFRWMVEEDPATGGYQSAASGKN
jgi:hypothetical protein